MQTFIPNLTSYNRLTAILAVLAVLTLPACYPDDDPGPTDIVATVVWADTGEPLRTGSVSFRAIDGEWFDSPLSDQYGPFGLEGPDSNPVHATIPGLILRETGEYPVAMIDPAVSIGDTTIYGPNGLGGGARVSVGRSNEIVLRVPRF